MARRVLIYYFNAAWNVLKLLMWQYIQAPNLAFKCCSSAQLTQWMARREPKGSYQEVGHAGGVHSWPCHRGLLWARAPFSSSGRWRLWYIIHRCKMPGTDLYLGPQLHPMPPMPLSLFWFSRGPQESCDASTRIPMLSMCAQVHTWGNSSQDWADTSHCT